MGALMGEDRAFACVKKRALFQQSYGLGYRIECTTALSQYLLTLGDNIVERLTVALFLFSAHCCARNRTCAAVNGDHCIDHNALPCDCIRTKNTDLKWFSPIFGDF